jgi:hypothetical protein
MKQDDRKHLRHDDRKHLRHDDPQTTTRRHDMIGRLRVRFIDTTIHNHLRQMKQDDRKHLRLPLKAKSVFFMTRRPQANIYDRNCDIYDRICNIVDIYDRTRKIVDVYDRIRKIVDIYDDAQKL